MLSTNMFSLYLFRNVPSCSFREIVKDVGQIFIVDDQWKCCLYGLSMSGLDSVKMSILALLPKFYPQPISLNLFPTNVPATQFI